MKGALRSAAEAPAFGIWMGSAMTQIIAAIGPGFLFQASDRLVSVLPELRPYDSNANKSLIVGCADGVALVGYTGVAYIGGRPTDQWIAETLTGLDLSTPFLMSGACHEHGDEPLHVMVGRLAEALGVALQSRPDLAHEILVVGWTYSERGSVPTGYARIIRWAGGRLSVESPAPRIKPHDDLFHLVGVPRVARAVTAPLVQAISVWTGNWDIEALELAAAGTIQSISRKGIGPDALIITVRFADFPPHARVRFMPAGSFSEAFTPWVITPCGITAPSAEVGGPMTASFGRLDVEVICVLPRAGETKLLSSSPMKRKPPPR